MTEAETAKPRILSKQLQVGRGEGLLVRLAWFKAREASDHHSHPTKRVENLGHIQPKGP